MRTWLILWPPASDTPAAPLPTASAPSMASRSVASDTPNPCTAIITEEEPTLITARNDGMINSFNPVQLSAWRDNVDMQYTVSHQRVLQYCSPRVSHGHSLSKRSSPPSSVVSEKATPLSRQCRSCSSTPWERETTLPRRPATCSCSSPCSRHHVTSSSSASMGLVLFKTTWRRVSGPQDSPSSTTTWDDLTPLT